MFGIEVLSMSVPTDVFVNVVHNWRGTKPMYNFLKQLSSVLIKPSATGALSNVPNALGSHLFCRSQRL